MGPSHHSEVRSCARRPIDQTGEENRDQVYATNPCDQKRCPGDQVMKHSSHFFMFLYLIARYVMYRPMVEINALLDLDLESNFLARRLRTAGPFAFMSKAAPGTVTGA